MGLPQGGVAERLADRIAEDISDRPGDLGLYARPRHRETDAG
jgi:hypothetical protein